MGEAMHPVADGSENSPTMNIHELQFDGGMLQRGFWLYVWEITPPSREPLYYVGRTGDSSSTNAQSPFNRMGQHFGFAENSSMVRNHLSGRSIRPEDCHFKLVALGPIESESIAVDRAEHDKRRDTVAAMEKALAIAMTDAGYCVMNDVKSRKVLNQAIFSLVLEHFSKYLPKLRTASPSE
jgi:hypothetical protein